MDQNDLAIHMQNKTLDQAAASLAQDRADAEAQGDKEKAALAANDLGVVYSLLSRGEDARAALSQAQQLFIELNDAAGQGRAAGNLGQLEERAGNTDAAGALYEFVPGASGPHQPTVAPVRRWTSTNRSWACGD